jgi:hypothetical protein
MADENIVPLGVQTTQDISVERVLDASYGLAHVLVLGRDEDGNLVASSSSGSVGYILELLEEFKYKLISGAYGPPVQR